MPYCRTLIMKRFGPNFYPCKRRTNDVTHLQATNSVLSLLCLNEKPTVNRPIQLISYAANSVTVFRHVTSNQPSRHALRQTFDISVKAHKPWATAVLSVQKWPRRGFECHITQSVMLRLLCYDPLSHLLPMLPVILWTGATQFHINYYWMLKTGRFKLWRQDAWATDV